MSYCPKNLDGMYQSCLVSFWLLFSALFTLHLGICNYFQKDFLILDACISLVPTQEIFTGHESSHWRWFNLCPETKTITVRSKFWKNPGLFRNFQLMQAYCSCNRHEHLIRNHETERWITKYLVFKARLGGALSNLI